ncbi:hypothetical protein PCC6912_42820 [Chlorogloeopsis fritschii PCC 6912]|uniref:Uncharacterized protein n=2 Tax=Chlorogloeopsis fritschii TaxID=1124 RepID=A0A3S1FEC8_CHLFR|nr:hypothetical protein PCC6912_42820 [Chlorogloeopsis fritschii PCC 6912]
MPMMIFILASGYLLTIYLLLALARRTGQKNASGSVTLPSTESYTQEAAVPPKVTEVSSVR